MEGMRRIHVGRSGQNLELKCLAIADDVAHNQGFAEKMLNTLHAIVEKTGLKVSYEKTQYMNTDIDEKATWR